MKIPFNIPFISGKEKGYISDAVNKIISDQEDSYVNKCTALLKGKWNYKNLYLTSSCTAALEICALLLDIKPGDEVIIPSYTFPSTANAFLRAGAKIVFADSRSDFPGIDERTIESLISSRTKAIVPVHYAGIACDMDEIMRIAEKHKLYVVEDGAAAIDSIYKSRQLGSIGHLGCLSFHQTKNLQCGEGGAIIINDERYLNQVKNILEKGTNRNDMVSGKVERYEWVDIGSSFLMSELHAAYLFAQIEKAEWIIEKRLLLWNLYYNSLKILKEKDLLNLPYIPRYAGHNAHTFYIILKNNTMMTDLKSFLKKKGIQTTVHYSSLDQSIFWKKNHYSTSTNIQSLRYNNCLLRLPLFNSMTNEDVEYVTSTLLSYFNI
jgi:dTDP-4-amino-4,6-dideoxygalactose transaminase